MVRGAALVLGVALAVAACSLPGSQARPSPGAGFTIDRTPVTVRIGHTQSLTFAPLYVALDRGYFSQLNVRVDLVQVRLGQDPIQLASLGQLDAVVVGVGASVFQEAQQGRKFKLAGSMAVTPTTSGRAPSTLEVAKTLVDAGQVHTPADLKGHTIAITGGAEGPDGYLTDLVLGRSTVGLESLKTIDLAAPDMEAAIKSGGIDAALAPAPIASAMEQDGTTVAMGNPPSGISVSGVLFGGRFGGSAAQRVFIALAHAARDLEAATRSGTMPDAMVATLARYTGLAPDAVRATPPYDWDPDLRPDAVTLGAMQDTYRRFGLLTFPQNVPAGKYVDQSYWKVAQKALG